MSRTFFEDFFGALDEFVDEVSGQFEWPHIVMAGDFNFVFKPNVDSLNRQTSQSESALSAMVEGHLEERELIDSILFDSHSTDRFTWRRDNCCLRLDYIFVSTGLSGRVQQSITEWYTYGSRYDHASVSVKIGKSNNILRGRSFPKLFKSEISSSNSVPWLIERLEEARAQIPTYWNPHQVHDFLKMTLRSKTLELRAMNKRQTSTAAITEKINQYLLYPTDESLRQANQLKAQLLQAEEEEAEVLKLKAGIKWREQGERSSKYFLSRLKARELSREMQELVDLNGAPISSLQAILDHVKVFYESLYRKLGNNMNRADPDFFAQCPTLDPVQQQQLSSAMSISELKESLKTCQDSAPGLDGIPYSFYSTFGDILLPSLLNSWNHSLVTGSLAQSHLQSCITLLP